MLSKIRNILHKRFGNNKNSDLRFYNSNENRYNVHYKKVHLCTCNKSQKEEVEQYFVKHFDGENISEISSALKNKYNLKIQNKKSYPNGRKKKPKKVSYKTAKLCFYKTVDGRMQVKVRDNGKSHTVCSCYPHQQEEVLKKFNTLKKENNLETIKIILKEEYNLVNSRRKL